MMCVRMYVSVVLRNVVVMSRRNFASMMLIRTPSNILIWLVQIDIVLYNIIVYITSLQSTGRGGCNLTL